MINEGTDLVAGPYTADGINNNYTFSFPCTDEKNIEVTVSVSGVETILTLGTQYTVSLNADQSTTPGGTVYTTALLAAGNLVALASSVPLKQGLDLTQGGAFNPDAIEAALDNLVLLIGQSIATIDRCLKLDITDTSLASTLQDELMSISANAASAAANAATAAAAAAVIDGFEPVGTYVKNTFYKKNNLILGVDTVTPDSLQNGTTYRAVADFTSANLATDTASLADDITNGKVVVFAKRGASGSGSGDMQAANNLSDVASAATARANLGLGDAAVKTVGALAANVPDNSIIYGKHTIWVPAGAMVPRLTQGPAVGTIELPTNKIMLKTLDFDYAVQNEYAQFAVRMPKSWDEGTMYAAFVWSHAAGATLYGLVLGIHGLAVGDNAGAGDALDAAMGTAVLTTDAGGTANDMYQSPVATLTVSGGTPAIAGTPAAEDMIIFEVYRDFAHASDTLDKDARLHGVVLFYNVDAHNDA